MPLPPRTHLPSGRRLVRVRLAAVPRALLAVLAVALVVRVAAVGLVDVALINDPVDYDAHAQSIAAGDGYPDSYARGGGPTAFRPPLYPTFLAAVYEVAGHRVGAARLAQA